MFQGSPVGYLQVDEENQLIWCNEQARSLLQIQRWEPGQVRLLLELVRSYELDQLIEQTRNRQQPESKEWVFHPPYKIPEAMGSVRSLTLRASSWPLPQGQVGVFLENRQPLVELFQSHERWISDLAHELRTPLTSIRLVAETLQNRLQPPMSRWVEQMLQETNRLINLVQDWLELTQLQGDLSKHLTTKPLELCSLIQSVWQTLEPLARQKQLSLNCVGLDAVWLKADESRLYRVFLNLFHNSIKYSPLEGSIRVEVNLSPGEDAPKLVEINIIDSGTGFTESDLSHVFERLYRGDPARTSQSTSSGVVEELRRDSVGGGESPVKEVAHNFSTSGSGLGLTIVREIILAHGGSVRAKNHPETGGAWLQIQLPLA
jgi:two-component system phosphate regulon sensor histidine kinase PhoR